VSTILSSTTTVATGLAVADPVIVVWQNEDIGTFPSDYAESLVKRFGVASPSHTAMTTPDFQGPTTAATSDDLSTVAQVGIGVGVALAAAMAGGLFIFWCLRRRWKAVATTNVPDTVIPEMEDQDYFHSQRKWFFGGRWRNEIDSQAAQSKLDSKTVHVVPRPPAELEAPEQATSDAARNGEARMQHARAEDRMR
jgi:hypothetical protein